MNGAEHGEATTTASTPDSASLTTASSRSSRSATTAATGRISNSPDRFSASTKNSSASPAIDRRRLQLEAPAELLLLPRAGNEHGSEQPERHDDSGRECEPVLAHRRTIAALRREAQHLQRQHREHAGHQVQQHAADQRERDRGAQRQRVRRPARAAALREAFRGRRCRRRPFRPAGRRPTAARPLLPRYPSSTRARRQDA